MPPPTPSSQATATYRDGEASREGNTAADLVGVGALFKEWADSRCYRCLLYRTTALPVGKKFRTQKIWEVTNKHENFDE
jgi:hypothetical protein